MLINEWKAENITFFFLNLQERFDDKNSLKGGFFAISGAYMEVSKNIKKRERKKKQ